MEVDIEKKIRMSRLFDLYGAMLSDRQREIIALCYDDDLSLSEIADITGITRQGVRDARRKSELILLSYEEKLGLLARFDALEGQIGEVRDLVAEGEGEEISPAFAERITSYLDKISL